MCDAQAMAYLREIESRGSVLGLSSVRALLDALGNPQDSLRFVHIAGTNGKGSVLAYLSTILQAAGYRVGCYLSPTLFSYRERFQVNGREISRQDLARLAEKARQAEQVLLRDGRMPPTAFEVETAIAFLYFLEQGCDIVVLETGMGGDTDATNIVRTTVLSVLMPIGMDHMQFLGNSLAEIARHKAGILKPGVPVVCAPQPPEAMEVIASCAKRQNARLYVVDPDAVTDRAYGLESQSFSYRGRERLQISLSGVFQIQNAAVAVLAADVLRANGWPIGEEQLREGLSRAVWHGRFEVLRKDPLFLVDGAHNRDGAAQLAASVRTYLKNRRVIGICGVLKDKEYREILAAMVPCLSMLVCIEPPENPRALSAGQLAAEAAACMGAQSVQTAQTVGEAVAAAMRLAKKEDAILAFGSLSFVGELTRQVRGQ